MSMKCKRKKYRKTHWERSPCFPYVDWYGHCCPVVPKGKPPALQIMPPWGHILTGCYKDNEVLMRTNTTN